MKLNSMKQNYMPIDFNIYTKLLIRNNKINRRQDNKNQDISIDHFKFFIRVT